MDREGDLVRRLIASGDPDVLRTGLLSMGWPEAMASEQAASLRLGLDPSGIERQIAGMASQYSRESPGPYETLFENPRNKRPSPRQQYRKQYEDRRR